MQSTRFIRPRVILRADGNGTIGLGHVIRSLALVDMLRRHFECFFMISNPEPPIARVISQACILMSLPAYGTVEEEIADLQGRLSTTDILVVDGYRFGSEYQRNVRPFVSKLVAIDDLATGHFYADLVINHGSPEVTSKYDTESYTRLLTGFQFVLLRPPFLSGAKNSRSLDKCDSLFIAMGGADPFKVTPKVLKAALACEFLSKIVVVTGSAYGRNLFPDISKTEKIIVIKQNVVAQEMVSLMRECSLAISTASTVALELCAVKSGLILGTVAENQHHVHKYLLESSCAVSVGNLVEVHEKDIADVITQMNNIGAIRTLMINQARVIDGLSGSRILNEFISLLE